MATFIVGFGKMGATYVRILVEECKVPVSELIIVDRDPARLQECEGTYAGIQTFPSIAYATAWHTPTTAFVLTNVPEHLSAINHLACCEDLENLFVEKPLILPEQLSDLTSRIRRKELRVCVGYQMNFSMAVNALFAVMEKKQLIVCEGRGFWEKNRFDDHRPTTGNLEEITHALCLLLRAAWFHQDVTQIDVNAALSKTPYAHRTFRPQHPPRRTRPSRLPRPTRRSVSSRDRDALSSSRRILLSLHSNKHAEWNSTCAQSEHPRG